MTFPTELRYSQAHIWVAQNEDESVTLGITEFAQEELGDIVFVETPLVDKVVEADEAVAVVESVKAASDIYAPIAGTIIDANGALADSPELINDSPYEGGWIFKMKPDEETAWEDLMDADSYEAFLSAEN